MSEQDSVGLPEPRPQPRTTPDASATPLTMRRLRSCAYALFRTDYPAPLRWRIAYALTLGALLPLATRTLRSLGLERHETELFTQIAPYWAPLPAHPRTLLWWPAYRAVNGPYFIYYPTPIAWAMRAWLTLHLGLCRATVGVWDWRI